MWRKRECIQRNYYYAEKERKGRGAAPKRWLKWTTRQTGRCVARRGSDGRKRKGIPVSRSNDPQPVLSCFCCPREVSMYIFLLPYDLLQILLALFSCCWRIYNLMTFRRTTRIQTTRRANTRSPHSNIWSPLHTDNVIMEWKVVWSGRHRFFRGQTREAPRYRGSWAQKHTLETCSIWNSGSRKKIVLVDFSKGLLSIVQKLINWKYTAGIST